mgnify:FL=1
MADDSRLTREILEQVLRFWSLPDVAKRLGLSVSTLRRWRNGNVEPKGYALLALHELLRESVADGAKRAEFTFIDLFAGIGGLRLAFEDAGGKCVYTSEWDEYAHKTYRANFSASHELAGDITKVDARDIPDHDVLVAGFPCQPFSRSEERR